MTDAVDVAGTAHRHDLETRCGSALLADGRLLPYDAAAFDAGGLRLLRPGQRVRVRVVGDLSEGTARAIAVTLATFEL